jgi:hypothetical protein
VCEGSLDAPCSPVGIVSGCSEGNRFVAAAVRVRAPVGDQLQFGQLCGTKELKGKEQDMIG